MNTHVPTGTMVATIDSSEPLAAALAASMPPCWMIWNWLEMRPASWAGPPLITCRSTDKPLAAKIPPELATYCGQLLGMLLLIETVSLVTAEGADEGEAAADEARVETLPFAAGDPDEADDPPQAAVSSVRAAATSRVGDVWRARNVCIGRDCTPPGQWSPDSHAGSGLSARYKTCPGALLATSQAAPPRCTLPILSRSSGQLRKLRRQSADVRAAAWHGDGSWPSPERAQRHAT